MECKHSKHLSDDEFCKVSNYYCTEYHENICKEKKLISNHYWVYYRNGSSSVQCTGCKTVFEEYFKKYNFCPVCGAKMKGIK